MLLTAVVTGRELHDLIASLTPLKLRVGERRRTVSFGRPQTVELVPGRGLRLRGDARIVWDVAGVAIPVTIQAWQVLLEPRVVVRARSSGEETRVVAFDPVIEELDLKLVPGFLDGKIADAIRDGVAQNKGRLGWDFARALSRSLPLPLSLSPSTLIELAATDASIEVDADALRLSVSFEARAVREPEAAKRAPRSRPAPLTSRRHMGS